MGQRKNMQYIQTFGSLALSNILAETKTKSDYQKIWQGILVKNSSDTHKHFCI